jgi:hypothetical protein
VTASCIAVGGALGSRARYPNFGGLALAPGAALRRGTPSRAVTGRFAISGAAGGPSGDARAAVFGRSAISRRTSWI